MISEERLKRIHLQVLCQSLFAVDCLAFGGCKCPCDNCISLIAASAVALLLERYNMLYIYSPQFDSGGKVRITRLCLLNRQIAAAVKLSIWPISRRWALPSKLIICMSWMRNKCSWLQYPCLQAFASKTFKWVSLFVNASWEGQLQLQMWVEVYEQVITALFFFEAIMIALLAIKRSFAAILVSAFQTLDTHSG